MKAPVSILFIDDDSTEQAAFRLFAKAGRFRCTFEIASDVTEARRLLRDRTFDVILANHRLPDGTAFDIFETIGAHLVILMTESGEEEADLREMQPAVIDYVVKDPQRNYLRTLPGRIESALSLRRTQIELRESEGRLRDICDSTTDLIHSIAMDGSIQYVNRAWCQTLGYTEAEALKMNIFEIIHPKCRERCTAVFNRLRGGENVGTVDVVFASKAGREVNLEGRLSLRIDNGRAVSARGIFQDMTDRKRTNAKLEELTENLEKAVVERTGELMESQARFVQMAESIEEVFWMLDLNANAVIYVSPMYEKIWGRSSEALYANPLDWIEAIHPEDRGRAVTAFGLHGTQKYDLEFRIVRPDGSIRWVHDRGYLIKDADGEPYRVVGTAADITERKEMSDRLLRTQRMDSLGTLAGGVAHDLNNALAPILMGLELLRMTYPREGTLINTMESSAERGAAMVRQLLTFAKGVEYKRELLKPVQLLGEMERIIRGTFPKNIDLRISLAKNLQTVLGDYTQIHQVLLNLCVNARDAMPAGGVLTVGVENAEIDSTFASTVPDAKPGRYVKWQISDTGGGIPPFMLERIFEPFFTTKGPDKGTGLGLSTVTGIVRSHGGFMHVRSVIGQGSTFSFYLPVQDEELPQKSDRTIAPAPQFQGNNDTILVVDDEYMVQEMARAVLESMNFNVLTASDGKQALVHVANNPANLRVIITDMHMPTMDGLIFVRTLKSLNPDTAVIVASGHLNDKLTAEFEAVGVTALLHKPFTHAELVSALTLALGREPA